jgi:DNA-binding Lrp family transcriptional regulator
MEAAVNTTIEFPVLSLLTDEKLIAALKRRGPLTIEELSSESGLSWEQVFASVDRLSRSSSVLLHRVGSAYQVIYRHHMQTR